MAQKHSRGVANLISASWSFALSQPVLGGVIFWFWIIPQTIIDTVNDLPGLGLSPDSMGATNAPLRIVSGLAVLMLSLIRLWGTACVLLVGKRMIQNRSGRARTSFKAVRKEAKKFILPLILTSILRWCFVLFWSLLFFIPVLAFFASGSCSIDELSKVRSVSGLSGNCRLLIPMLALLLPAIFYYIRTIFTNIVIFADRRMYRSAIARSKQVVRGEAWRTLLMVAGLALVFLLPSAVGSIITDAVAGYDSRLGIPAHFLGNIIFACGELLFTLALIQFYGNLREKAQIPEEVTPD